MYKRLTLLFALTCFCNILFAQVNNDDWKLLKTVDELSVYYKASICNGDVVIVKFVNTKNQKVKVNWRLWENVPMRATLLLAGETKEGKCDSSPAFMLTDRVPKGLSVANIVVDINVELQ